MPPAPGSPDNRTSRVIPPENRRDFVVFFADMLTFGLAMSFVNRTTVLPSLVLRLTGSEPIVGLVETICNGAWLLPQLAAARFLATRRERRKYITRPVIVERLVFLTLPPMLLLVAGPHPATAATLLLVSLGLFFSLDAFASVAWFDLLSRALPPAPRARMIGLSQLASGIAGVGCGILVGRILGSPRLAFPTSYALLFVLANVFFIFDLVAILCFRDRPGRADAYLAPMGDFVRGLVRLVREDRRFALVVGVRLLVGASGMATPFYIIFALNGLHFGQASIGFFTAAQVIGGIASSLLMAELSRRRGTRAVIRLCAALALASPVVALATLAARHVLPPAGLQVIYALVFVTLGALANGGLAGFMSYLLEYAPPENRTVYVGLANTLNGAILVMPFVGGWILQGSSFAVLFAATAAVSVLGVLGSLRVAEPRHAAPTP
jgi:MFS family permease